MVTVSAVASARADSRVVADAVVCPTAHREYSIVSEEEQDVTKTASGCVALAAFHEVDSSAGMPCSPFSMWTNLSHAMWTKVSFTSRAGLHAQRCRLSASQRGPRGQRVRSNNSASARPTFAKPSSSCCSTFAELNRTLLWLEANKPPASAECQSSLPWTSSEPSKRVFPNLAAFHLVDGAVTSTYHGTTACLRRFSPALHERGLDLNLQKCNYIPVRPVPMFQVNAAPWVVVICCDGCFSLQLSHDQLHSSDETSLRLDHTPGAAAGSLLCGNLWSALHPTRRFLNCVPLTTCNKN